MFLKAEFKTYGEIDEFLDHQKKGACWEGNWLNEVFIKHVKEMLDEEKCHLFVAGGSGGQALSTETTDEDL